MTAKQELSIYEILQRARSLLFSQRVAFFRDLQLRASRNAAIEPGKLIAWPDAMTFLSESDWMEAYAAICFQERGEPK